MLLKDDLNNILDMFKMNFNTNNRENILTKVAKDEMIINYNNFFFKTGDPIINNFDFWKRFGTLYNLLIDYLIKI